MYIIRIGRLTISQAEEVIAVLWRNLEERGAPSPRLQVCQIDEDVDLGLESLSEQDAELAKQVLSQITLAVSAAAA